MRRRASHLRLAVDNGTHQDYRYVRLAAIDADLVDAYYSLSPSAREGIRELVRLAAHRKLRRTSAPISETAPKDSDSA